MSDILVFGNGWIGSRVAKFLEATLSSKRIESYEDIQSEIDQYKPKAIINCIGHYGKNVDDCEKDITRTLKSMSLIPLLMAEASIRNSIKLVHISTASIFNSNDENDHPRVCNEDTRPDYFDLLYSRSKIYSEAALYTIGRATDVLILRIINPLDCIPHKRNLLDKVLNFKSVVDIPYSVTYIPDFLSALKHLLLKNSEGLYNVCSYGEMKLPQLIEEYKKYDPNHSYSITSLSELKINRPSPIISSDKLEETGFNVRPIKDIIPECVETYMKYIRRELQ